MSADGEDRACPRYPPTPNRCRWRAATITLSWAGATHTGRRREINQDALLASYPLFIVADGMGGHIGGEIASASTVDRLGGVVDQRGP